MNCKAMHYNARAAKADGKQLSAMDRIIMLRSNFTHSEFQFSKRYFNVSWSFTLADGADGSRFKMIKYSHPKRWESDVIYLSNAQEGILFLEACRLADTDELNIAHYCIDYDKYIMNAIEQGKNHWKYDTKGLLTHATKKSKKWWLNLIRQFTWCWTKLISPAKSKMWCSEGVGHLIKTCWHDFCKKPDEYDPEELSARIKKYFSKNL